MVAQLARAGSRQRQERGRASGARRRHSSRLRSFRRPSRRHAQPRELSWLCSSGSPQKTTCVPSTCAAAVAFDDRGASPRSRRRCAREASSTTGTASVSKPKRAGSPGAGSRLNSGTARVVYPTGLGARIVTVATPIAESAGHRLRTPPAVPASEEKSASVHCAAAVMLPEQPRRQVEAQVLGQRRRARRLAPWLSGLLDF